MEPASAGDSIVEAGAAATSGPPDAGTGDEAAAAPTPADPGPADTDTAPVAAAELAEPTATGERSVVVAQVVLEMASSQVKCLICEFDHEGYEGLLTPEEIGGLQPALNDEYHAYAVYGQVIENSDAVRPFTSILQSEASHISALVGLFDVYGVPVPANPGAVRAKASPA